MTNKLYLLIILLLLLQINAFAYAKKIGLASFKTEKTAIIYLKQVNNTISKDINLSEILKKNNIAVNISKINDYYLVSIKVFQNRELLLKTIKIVRKNYKNACIQNTVLPTNIEVVPITKVTKKVQVVPKKVLKKETLTNNDKLIPIKKASVKELIITKNESNETTTITNDNIEEEDKSIGFMAYIKEFIESLNALKIIIFVVFVLFLYFGIKFKRFFDQY